MDDFLVKQIVVITPSITAKKICQRSKAITRPPLRTSITVLVSQGQLELSWWWWWIPLGVIPRKRPRTITVRSHQTSDVCR